MPVNILTEHHKNFLQLVSVTQEDKRTVCQCQWTEPSHKLAPASVFDPRDPFVYNSTVFHLDALRAALWTNRQRLGSASEPCRA